MASPPQPEDRSSTVRAARSERQSPTHGRLQVAPSQTIVTSDGRQIAGSGQLGVLVSRAEMAGNAGRSQEALGYIPPRVPPALAPEGLLYARAMARASGNGGTNGDKNRAENSA